jgi:hypothetical protein
MRAFLRTSQGTRIQLTKVLTVLFLVVIVGVFLTSTFTSRSEQQSSSSSLEDGLSLAEYWDSLDNNRRYTFDSLDAFFPSRILQPALSSKEKLAMYLNALQHAVSIVHLPRELTFPFIRKCSVLPKPSVVQHQHALEVTFPKMLRDMSHAASVGKAGFLDPVFVASNNATTGSALFYYVEGLPYHAVYCTSKSNNKDKFSSREDWTYRDPYWSAVGRHLLTLPSWSENMGIDFLAPASHPQMKPSRRHPFEVNYLQRLTFLSTDLDVAGYSPKDLVVPYLTEREVASMTKAKTKEPKFLLFFVGGDNPKRGLRSKLAERFEALGSSPDVYFSLDKAPPSPTTTSGGGLSSFLDSMSASTFCLVVRGDTSSSRRLFTAIALGCIPVIISDWISLPFTNVINYKAFALFFPEAVSSSTNGVRDMVQVLRSATPDTLASMRAALGEAKRVLLFNHFGLSGGNAVAALSVINPVTLTLVEALIARERLCQDRVPNPSTTPMQDMCTKIRQKMEK